jgi:hypothetical protein
MPEAAPAKPMRPKNAIVILPDSLNRHMPGAYGSRERDAADRLRAAPQAVDAPDDQFARLGLA